MTCVWGSHWQPPLTRDERRGPRFRADKREMNDGYSYMDGPVHSTQHTVTCVHPNQKPQRMALLIQGRPSSAITVFEPWIKVPTGDRSGNY